MKRKIITYGNDLSKFINKLSDSEQEFLIKNIALLENIDDLPYHYIKNLKKGLFEFRVFMEKKGFRIFFIFDKGKVIVLLNGFTKKTQKTPKKELDKARKLKKEYLKKYK